MSIKKLDDVSKIIVNTYNIAKNGIVTKKIIFPNEPPKLFTNLTEVKDGVYYDVYELSELIETQIIKKDNNTFIYDKERQMEYSNTTEIENLLKKGAETLHLHREFKNYIHEDKMYEILETLDKQPDLLKGPKQPESKIVEETNDNNIIDKIIQTPKTPQKEQKTSSKLAIAVENYLKELNNKKETYHRVKRNKKDKKTKLDKKRVGALGLALILAGTIYIANRDKSKETSEVHTPTSEVAVNVDESFEEAKEIKVIKEASIEDLYNNISIGESYYIESAKISESASSNPIGEIGKNNEYAPNGNYIVNQIAILEYTDKEKTEFAKLITNIGTEQIGDNITKITSENELPENYKIMVHLKDENGNPKGWTEATKEVFKDLAEQLKTVTISYRR